MGGATRFLFLLTPSLHIHHHRCPSILRQLRHRLQHPLGPARTTTRLLPIKSSRQLHTQPSSSFPPRRVSHPFHTLLDNLSACGYFNRLPLNSDEDYMSAAELPPDFLRSAGACLSFARERPNLLGLVSL